MSGARGTLVGIGNDFVVPVRPVVHKPAVQEIVSPALPAVNTEVNNKISRPLPKKHKVYARMDRRLSPIALVSLTALIVGVVGSQVASVYLAPKFKITGGTVSAAPAAGGINTGVSAAQLNAWLAAYSSQPATINLGSSTVAISPDTLKSWLQITPSPNKSLYGIHIKTSVIPSSIMAEISKHTAAPVNQVVVTRPDGSTEVAVGGKNGSQLSNPSSVEAQASEISRNLFDNKGFQINAPLVTLPFQSVTPAAFGKLLVADVNSMKMYAFQNGQLVNQFLVSAGKPSTPTPIGEFHIWEKLPVQDMRGYNPNGTPYFQPHVYWVNYFTHTGDAVHGVYWHPLSWFGVHNSSHGCVGVSDSDGEWIYNWAPIGTTVITTPN